MDGLAVVNVTQTVTRRAKQAYMALPVRTVYQMNLMSMLQASQMTRLAMRLCPIPSRSIESGFPNRICPETARKKINSLKRDNNTSINQILCTAS